MPIFILICLGILFSSKGSPIFSQIRTGYKERSFTIFKFRTMYVSLPRETKQTFVNSPEVFLFGKFLRRFKLDELPQVINILKGDMSFIGPRPCELSIYENMPLWAKNRFKVKPGISGLAQISGGYKIPWEKRWVYDIEYIKSFSFNQDLKIFIKTFYVIIFG
tara:strand:+ start:116 stop:604 length:489 start_codon:yes stop_codon:yes gene_type:complete